jgi:hypothetical protein
VPSESHVGTEAKSTSLSAQSSGKVWVRRSAGILLLLSHWEGRSEGRWRVTPDLIRNSPHRISGEPSPLLSEKFDQCPGLDHEGAGGKSAS